MGKVTVKKREPYKACYDMEHQFGVYGDHEQEVELTPFIQSKIQSGELIQVKEETPVETSLLTVDQFKDLKAAEQKQYLQDQGIEPGSNEEERVAQYEAWLGTQEQGAE